MPRRKLRLEEIEALIYEHDVCADGRLKPKFQIHIGSVATMNGKIIRHACKMGGVVKWRYHFNPVMVTTMPICVSCLHALMSSCDARAKALIFSFLVPPASNTGVN